MNLRILPSALTDLWQGWMFYENQREGLGNYFQDALFADIDSLLLYAGTHRKVFGYYRMLAKRFPFAIYYKMEASDKVVVWRVLDMRQAPQNMRRRLRYRRPPR